MTIVGASMLTTEVARQLNLDQRLVEAIGLLRWPVVFVFLSVAVGALYKLAPNVRVPFRWCLVGGALFSVGWIVATALFSLYVANFASYSNTYGALGGVIVLMLWFYISALILVASAALVAAVLKETRPELVVATAAAKGIEPTSPPPVPRPTLTPNPGLVLAARMQHAASLRAMAAESRTPASIRQRRRRPEPAGWRSGPEDWAFAGIVTAFGVMLGAAAARLTGLRSKH